MGAKIAQRAARQFPPRVGEALHEQGDAIRIGTLSKRVIEVPKPLRWGWHIPPLAGTLLFLSLALPLFH